MFAGHYAAALAAKAAEPRAPMWTLIAGAQLVDIGWSALIDRPRSSDVKARTSSLVLAVSQARFLEISKRYGEVGLAVARLLAQRLMRTSDKLAELVALSVPHRLHQELYQPP